MGSTESVHVVNQASETDEEEEDEDEEVQQILPPHHSERRLWRCVDPERTRKLLEPEEEDEDHLPSDLNNPWRPKVDRQRIRKLLEQEPEALPCYASASPLSPQLSSLGTPRLGPSIKVWDPCNVLAPPPLAFSRSFSSIDEDHSQHHHHNRSITEVYLICHGECDLSLRPDHVGGRCDAAGLTADGKRQARALAVFLNSQRVRFNAVYSSSLDRARAMAISVCQEMNITEEHIQSSDALAEMSMGDWEGCLCSEVYTPENLILIESLQPDFHPPSGESLRQVEYRMVQFLNETVLELHEKLRSELASQPQTESLRPSCHSLHDQDLVQRNRQGHNKKKSGKSRLQVVTSVGHHEAAEDDVSPQEMNQRDLNDRSSSSTASTCVGVFSHAMPIKCLITGLLGCSPVRWHKICIEDSSVTVLQHSWRREWQIKRLNDTAHLRLL